MSLTSQVHGRPLGPIQPHGLNIRLAASDPQRNHSLTGKTPHLMTALTNKANGNQQNQVNWILPLQGTWTPGPAETTPEAESSTSVLSNGARVISCSGCSGNQSVGWIGGPSDGTLQIVGVQSDASTTSTIRVKYENGDSSQRYATVNVNGISQVLAFLPSGDGNTPASSTLHVQLQSGSSNTVTFSAYQQGYGRLLSFSSLEVIDANWCRAGC